MFQPVAGWTLLVWAHVGGGVRVGFEVRRGFLRASFASLPSLQWYRSPDYDLFRPYAERRRRRPAQPFYILHPAFLWQLWDFIQGHTQEDIQPNPPSSGFIGKCRPSVRLPLPS